MKMILSKNHKKLEIGALRGKAAAHLDIARGRYRVLIFGLRRSWEPEYARLLRDRYGVELKPVAGCIVSQGLIWYVDGYDKVSTAAVIRKYGHDIFEESERGARKTWGLRAGAKVTRD
jgi:hypothetical protein